MRSVAISRNRKRHGLTLIELVVVVAVLAILAGFIVPRLAFVRNLAADSGNATIIADAATQHVLYNTAIGHYPGGEDSLLDTTNALYANLNANLAAVLTPLNLSSDNNAAKSIVGQIDPKGASFDLYYGTAGGSPLSTPNSDFTNLVPVTYSKGAGGAGYVAQVTVPTSLTSPSYAIYNAAYGNGALNQTTGAPLDGTYLVAFGYGPNDQINGTTGLAPPVEFDKITGEYTRPIVLLKVFPTGSTALGVPAGTNAATQIAIGFDATTIGNNVAKYSVDQSR